MGGKIHERAREMIYPETNIQITNNKIVEIENCKKIIEYNDIHICLRTYLYELHIWGENLSADDYGGGGIRVSGTIKSIEFEALRL